MIPYGKLQGDAAHGPKDLHTFGLSLLWLLWGPYDSLRLMSAVESYICEPDWTLRPSLVTAAIPPYDMPFACSCSLCGPYGRPYCGDVHSDCWTGNNTYHMKGAEQQLSAMPYRQELASEMLHTFFSRHSSY